MPIRFRCSNPMCESVVRAPDTAAGRQAKCPSCGQIVTVPAASEVLDDLPAAAPSPAAPSAPEARRSIPPIDSSRRSGPPWFVYAGIAGVVLLIGGLIYIGFAAAGDEDEPEGPVARSERDGRLSSPARDGQDRSGSINIPASPQTPEPNDPRDLGPEREFKEKREDYISLQFRSRDNARREASLHKLRNVGKALAMYESAEGRTPKSWDDMIRGGYLSKGLLVSPGDMKSVFVFVKPDARSRDATIIAYDPVPYLGNRFNALFTDFRVKEFAQNDLQALLQK